MTGGADDRWLQTAAPTGVRMADDGVPDGVAAAVQEYIENRHDYLAWLNTSVDEVSRGRVVLSIPYETKLTNRPPREAEDADGRTPTIHGGIAASLIDTAGGMALRTTFDDPMGEGVATVNLSVNYLERATGDLTATAEVVRTGNTIGVTEMRVTTPGDDGDERVAVATGQGAYRLFRER